MGCEDDVGNNFRSENLKDEQNQTLEDWLISQVDKAEQLVLHALDLAVRSESQLHACQKVPWC